MQLAVPVLEHKFTRSRVEELLGHPACKDSEICAKLGYSLVLIPVNPSATDLIPPSSHASNLPLSFDPTSNRFATKLMADLDTGLAPGCVMGNVYVVRKDYKPFSVAEWARLDDTGIAEIMDAFGDGHDVTDATYSRARENLQFALEYNPYGPQSGTDED